MKNIKLSRSLRGNDNAKKNGAKKQGEKKQAPDGINKFSTGQKLGYAASGIAFGPLLTGAYAGASGRGEGKYNHNAAKYSSAGIATAGAFFTGAAAGLERAAGADVMTQLKAAGVVGAGAAALTGVHYGAARLSSAVTSRLARRKVT